MNDKINWNRITQIIADLERATTKEKAIREPSEQLKEFQYTLQNSDDIAKNICCFLFQQSILPLIGDENLSSTLIEGILILFSDILDLKIKLSVKAVEASQLICFVLKHGLELGNQRELFEEIGTVAFTVLSKLVEETTDVREAAFLISVSLDYATKSTLVHGYPSLSYLKKLLLSIPAENLKSVLPGVSVALTTLISNKNRHQVVIESIEILQWMWTTCNLTEDDASKLSELINRIFEQKLDNPKCRVARVNMSGILLEKCSEIMKDGLSPCIKCLFAAISDESQKVQESAEKPVLNLGGSIQISAVFEQCVNDLMRFARSADEHKRLSLLQSIAGIISINTNNPDFKVQLLTSLHSLTTALVTVSEIYTNDDLICEVNGGFILHRRLYLNTALHFSAFQTILINLPTDDFVDVLIDVLAENPYFAPEIFSIFEIVSSTGPKELMMSVIEQSNWWNPQKSNPRAVLTLEIVLETTAKLCGTAMLQKLLYRLIECLASPHPTVVQTAQAALEEISPNKNVAKLLMDNVDYITDRLIARLQFVDVSPEVLTVFSAILSVDGDISDLLSHLMPRIYELLDTRDSFSLPILRMFPRVAIKIPSQVEQVIDRSIHFVLAPSISLQCAALDSIIAAIPLFEDHDKLLPMIHQMWAPSVLIMKSSADCSNSAARRAVNVCETALLAERSFVRARVRELLPLFSELVEGNLKLLESNPEHRHALKMMHSLLDLFLTALEGDNIFDCMELEVFKTLLFCFEQKVKPELTDKALKCLSFLYQSSKAFVWTLMMEVSQKYPVGQLPIKKTQYFESVSRDVRLFVGKLL
ncbi:hypothetical protein TRFO_00802 [Tritrichomonas foetus]|uniref:TTI1 C-terminal TPR domain-containing protein n=1 Tax=Tritrichomonas foetus TaxID=1144522 RepID=A0A1J4L288_9EUKA|nr:hypothetical protein TRFO_00802 [Tritrichomonas foetus]|eukprot:OHT17563.1 hypothetical protein TRFO_00802 [Tritrichomonas foetus]